MKKMAALKLYASGLIKTFLKRKLQFIGYAKYMIQSNLHFMVLSFSLQPVRDTREKQVQLWKELILDYCRSQKIFIIGLDEDFPLFTNPVIESEWPFWWFGLFN